MANPLENEAEIYERIKDEKIGIDPLIWEVIYRDVGDSISAINLIIANSVEFNEPIPVADAGRILIYTKRINEVFNKLIHPETICDQGGLLAKIKNGHIELNPLVKELFAHYVANDNCAINFCLSYYLDPGYEEPVPVTEAQKIFDHARSMSGFLERLRTAVKKGDSRF